MLFNSNNMASIDNLLSGVKRFGKSAAKYASITVLAFSTYACSDDPEGCTEDSQCRPPRVCRNYECVSPSGNVGYDAGDDAEYCECDRAVDICNVRVLGDGAYTDCECDSDCPSESGSYSCLSDGYCDLCDIDPDCW